MTTSSYRRWTACTMTALLLSGTAAAQSPGTLLVGGFGQWTHYDKSWNLDNGNLGIGFRFGAYIAPNWNIEGDGSYTSASAKSGTRFLNSPSSASGGNVKASALSARLVYTMPAAANRPSIHFGGGAVLENFRDSTGSAATYQFGFNGLAGINVALSGLVLRADAFGNYLPSADGRLDFGLQAGFQFSPEVPVLFGGGPRTRTAMAAPVVWWDSLDTPLPGTLELGGFLQYTRFDDSAGRQGANPKNGMGFGVRAGVFLLDPRWEIEWDGYYAGKDNNIPFGGGFNPTAAPTEVNAHAVAMRLNYNDVLDVPGGHLGQFMVGVGGVRTSYKFVGGTGKGSVSNTFAYNYGVSGLLGARVGISNRTALRFDGVLDYMPNSLPSGTLNITLRGGVSWMLGGARSQAPAPPPPAPSPPG